MKRLLGFVQSLWYWFIIFIVRLFCLLWGIRYFGQANIPARGGVIIASNHQSYLDPPLVSIGLVRPIHFMARRELFEFSWLFNILISSVNAFPLERRRFNSEGIREALNRLRNGHMLLVFPEGTRTPDGEIKEFKTGVATITRRADVPVIPTRISGAFDTWPREHKLPARWRPIRIIYGKPLIIDRNLSPEEIARLIQDAVSRL